jgi:hypothetical protein
MSSTTSTVTPLIVETASNQNAPDYVTIIHPDGSISYEPNIHHHQQPTIIRRSYAKPRQSKYRYTLEQVYFISIACFFSYLFYRKEKHTIGVNGVDIGVLVNVLFVVFVIEY